MDSYIATTIFATRFDLPRKFQLRPKWASQKPKVMVHCANGKKPVNFRIDRLIKPPVAAKLYGQEIEMNRKRNRFIFMKEKRNVAKNYANFNFLLAHEDNMFRLTGLFVSLEYINIRGFLLELWRDFVRTVTTVQKLTSNHAVLISISGVMVNCANGKEPINFRVDCLTKPPVAAILYGQDFNMNRNRNGFIFMKEKRNVAKNYANFNFLLAHEDNMFRLTGLFVSLEYINFHGYPCVLMGQRRILSIGPLFNCAPGDKEECKF